MSDRQGRIARLGVAMCLLGVVWLVVLPAIAQNPRVAAYHRFLQQRHINPDAMFYTELEWWDHR